LSAHSVLVYRPMMPLIMDQLGARFTLHHWSSMNEAEKAGFVTGEGRSLRAISFLHGTEKLDGRFMDQFPKLEIIANFGVGYDAINAHDAAKRNIIVTNTPDVLTEEVADLTLGLLLATIRRLPQADAYLRRGDWMKAPFPLSASLRGKSAGIIGLGRIGKAIAKRLEGFGVALAYHGRRPQADIAYPYHPTVEALAEAVDILIVIAPGGEGTKHIVGRDALEALGPQGTLINVARGSLVDEAALTQALKSGKLGAAGLDVFETEPCHPAELIAMENVVLLPHIGSASVHTRNAMGQLVVDNITSWFDHGRPLTPVAETPWRG
jgi:lactate dehydrogenase-like 2-hydroxyacid dehydrogenase